MKRFQADRENWTDDWQLPEPGRADARWFSGLIGERGRNPGTGGNGNRRRKLPRQERRENRKNSGNKADQEDRNIRGKGLVLPCVRKE